MDNNINNYESLKANYADSQLRAYPWHLNRLKYWQDKKLYLETWAAQGFSHGKDYSEEHVPQKHFKGDFTEQKILDYSEQLEAIEAKIAEERAVIDTIDAWLLNIEQENRWVIKDYYWKGKSLEVIADLYGCSRNTIRNMIHKILMTYPSDDD